MGVKGHTSPNKAQPQLWVRSASAAAEPILGLGSLSRRQQVLGPEGQARDAGAYFEGIMASFSGAKASLSINCAQLNTNIHLFHFPSGSASLRLSPPSPLALFWDPWVSGKGQVWDMCSSLGCRGRGYTTHIQLLRSPRSRVKSGGQREVCLLLTTHTRAQSPRA